MSRKKNHQTASAYNGKEAAEARFGSSRAALTSTTDASSAKLPSDVEMRFNTGSRVNEEAPTNHQVTIIATAYLPANAVQEPPDVANRLRTHSIPLPMPTPTKTEQSQPIVSNPELPGDSMLIRGSSIAIGHIPNVAPTAAWFSVEDINRNAICPENAVNDVPTNQQAIMTSTKPMPMIETVSTVQEPATNSIDPTLADRMRSRFISTTLPISPANDQAKRVVSNPEIPGIGDSSTAGLTPNVEHTSAQLSIEKTGITSCTENAVTNLVPTAQPPTQPMPVQPTVDPTQPISPSRNRTRSLHTTLNSGEQSVPPETDLSSGGHKPLQRPYRNPRDPFFYNRMSTRSVSKTLQDPDANQEPLADALNPESSIVLKRSRTRSVAARLWPSGKSVEAAQKDAVSLSGSAAKPPAKKRGRPFKKKRPPPPVIANPTPETAIGQSLPVNQESAIPKVPGNLIQPPPPTRMRTRSIVSNIPATLGDSSGHQQLQTPPTFSAVSLPFLAPQQHAPTKRMRTRSVTKALLSSSLTEPATSGNASSQQPLNSEPFVEQRRRTRSAFPGLRTSNDIRMAVTPSVSTSVPAPARRGRPRRIPTAPSNRRIPSPPTRMHTRSVSKALATQPVGTGSLPSNGVASNKEATPPSVPVTPDSAQPTPKKRGRPFKNYQSAYPRGVILVPLNDTVSTTPKLPVNRIQPPPPTRTRTRSAAMAVQDPSQLPPTRDAVPSGQQRLQPSPRKMAPMSKPTRTRSVATEVPPSETGQNVEKEATGVSSTSTQIPVKSGGPLIPQPKATKSAPLSSADPEVLPVLHSANSMPSPPPVPAVSNRKRTHAVAESQESSQPKRANLAIVSPPPTNDIPSDDDSVFPSFTRFTSVNEIVLPKAVEPASSSCPPTLTAVTQLGSTHPAPLSPSALTPSGNQVVPATQPSTDKQSVPPVLKRKRAPPAAYSPTSSQPKPPKSTTVRSGPELSNVTPLSVASLSVRPPATVEVTTTSLSKGDPVNESQNAPAQSLPIGEASPPALVSPNQKHNSADKSNGEPRQKRWKYVPMATPIMPTRLRTRKMPQKHAEVPTPPKTTKTKQRRSKSAADPTPKNPASGKSDSKSANVPQTSIRRIVQVLPSGQQKEVQDAPTTSAISSSHAFEPAPRPPTPVDAEPEAADTVVPKLASRIHPKSGYDLHIYGGLAEQCWRAVLDAAEKEEREGVAVKANYPCVMPWERDPDDPTFGLTPENIAARNKMELPLPRQPGDTLPRSYLHPNGLHIITEEQYTQIALAHNLAIDMGMKPENRPVLEPRQKVPAKKNPASATTPKPALVPAAKTPSNDQPAPSSSSMPLSAASNMSTKTSLPDASKPSANPAPGSKTPVRCHPVVIKPVIRSQQSTTSTVCPPAPLTRVPDRPPQGIVMVSDDAGAPFLPPPAEILESRPVVATQQNTRPTHPSNRLSNQQPPSLSSRYYRNPTREDYLSSDSLD